MSAVTTGGMSKEEIKDKAQDYLMQTAKSEKSDLVLNVIRDWTQASDKESFLELYPESHPAHSIALATAIVGG